MNLLELDPQFIRYDEQYGRVIYHHVPELGQAQGVRFLCPHCKENVSNQPHWVLAWSRDAGTPDDAYPQASRWKFHGTDYDDLTLEHESGDTARPILFNGGCGNYGFINKGEVSYEARR